ncbi:indole-3-acetaldehyde oxidase-like isoform X3 [Bombyx mandarina]|uniref:Indole-3-acetaldehyde oxidase n=1 Tax=Bombyx mandarina TaxID=7092 RepID=A0A6J2JUU9_BOMMA|nr:indole-3-acetaldehyde oxidase-like isoform X3 [Bombyx mandarina]
MDKINFTINGEQYSLSGADVSPVTSLNDYIRHHLQLHGTKAMCHEGGCGACVVSVQRTHPTTKKEETLAVNSCLVHILSCHEWNITTVEGVGNRGDGYHAIQERLAMFNGTQCGYCTPGWVMNMYSLYKSSQKSLTTQQVENSFGSNICRCTGYRPILDAFKSFANDTEPSSKLQDLEDLHKTKCMNSCKRKCSISDEWCFIEKPFQSLLELSVAGGRWYKAFTVEDIFNILRREGSNNYRLVAGNTGQGVYPIKTEPKIYIDISSIDRLKDAHSDENLNLGAGLTLTETMDVFERWSTNEEYKYLLQLREHVDLVAHVPVRNIGTLGGNLALKNKHNEFPSDIFLLLETIGATVGIIKSDMKISDVSMSQFLKMDLKNNLIGDVKLPPLSANNLLRTYKIMPRAQNAHAIVNAGFLFKLDQEKKVASSNIIYGNISPSFVHATRTENNLIGLELFKDETLSKALEILEKEIIPVDLPPEPSSSCRKHLALGLFYKAILSLAPAVNPRYASGGTTLKRLVSRGEQTFETDKSLWPLNEPVPKLEALTQCSGEVKYACDVYTGPRTVHVAFVLSDVCLGEIESFDESEALKLQGVVGFYTAKDIPGKNVFTPSDVPWQDFAEEILASKKISYYGQPVALIAATTHRLAVTAANLVHVKYKKSNAVPVLSIQEALVAADKEQRVRQEVAIKATSKGSDTRHVIKGSFSMPSQYHYTMETQSCTVAVTSRGVAVRSATQWMDIVHVAVAQTLGIDENRVEVSVPRVGGAFGGKASRAALAACACAVVASRTHRAASLVMPLGDNMAAIGKRSQCDARYEVGVNDEGVVQYANIEYYVDCGYAYNDTSAPDVASILTNLYATDTWNINGYSVLTDKHSNTWCRAPGTTEATAILEHLMERIAQVTGKDPSEVRISNLAQKHEAIKDMITGFKREVEFDDRMVQIKKFNEENAWRKKALKLSIMSYPIGYSYNFPVTISIYHADGTVAISHGGIEMGQGINTKVAQVCAYSLKIPLAKVTVRGSNSFISPNSMASNGSITSDCVAYATVKACQELLSRLQDAKKDLNEPTWEETIKAAYDKGVNLQASYMTSPNDNLVGYDVYGVCIAEVELDVLTGNHILTRVDLLEDTGVSISPDIDVGQIEGAFVMGLGLWTTERLVYDKTGRLLTDRTWTYKPPGAKDIPVDFRVSFRRNAPNPAGVLRSKATGEPALVLAVVVIHALHETIVEARKEHGYRDAEWLHVDTPYSVENILEAISPKIGSFKLN